MKKFILQIILFTMLIPIFVNAQKCESDEIKIESIELYHKTDYVEESTPATINNNEINLDLKMYEINDFIEYKLNIKNNSNEPFILDEKNSDSDCLDYIMYTSDNSNVLNAHTSKDIYMRIFYNKEVPSSSFEGDKYSSQEVFSISASKENNILNPSTGRKSIILLLLLLPALTIYYYKGKKGHTKVSLLIISALWIVPINVTAICTNNIEVNINIDIMSYLNNPNYIHATSSHLLTSSGRLYSYNINNINYEETIPATLENLYATEIEKNVMHFEEEDNYYYTKNKELYTLDNSELILENIRDLYKSSYNTYAITNSNKLYRIKNGEALFVADNVSSIYNPAGAGSYFAIGTNGDVDKYTIQCSLDNIETETFEKKMFEGDNGSIVVGIYSRNKAIIIKNDKNDYYLSYINDIENFGPIKVNDLTKILERSYYHTDMAFNTDGYLTNIPNPTIAIEKPIVMAIENKSIIIDINNRLYKAANNTIDDTGLTVKKCATFFGGSSPHIACIDSDDYIRKDGSTEKVKFCTEQEDNCNIFTTELKVTKMGRYNNKYVVKTNVGSKYIWDNTRNYFKIHDFDESDIEWIDGTIEEYSPDKEYSYSTNTQTYKEYADDKTSISSNKLDYYINRVISNNIIGQQFILSKTENGWKYTHVNNSAPGGSEI